MKKEKIVNIPNFLSISRIVIALIIILGIFYFQVKTIAILFIIGMLTDFFDGQIARRFNMKTEFGRKADMVADRILMIGTALAFILRVISDGNLDNNFVLQMILILTRDIIALPFAIFWMFSGKTMPHANKFGKATTFFQGIAFPALILSLYYPVFSFSIYFAIATSLIGMFSAITFIREVIKK